ncbi:MAG: VanZ family protein [Acutalibacteraceae bacterium]
MDKSKLSRLFQIKNRKKLIICAALFVVWLIIMLTLSSQNGTQTAQVSNSIALWLTRIIYRDAATYGNLFAVHAFIRKAAHVFLFAVLSELLAEIVSCFKNARLWFCPLFSICIVSLFALVDEWHKLFISGRHFDMFDVMLNITGAAIGAAAFLLIHYLLQRRKRSDKSKTEQNKN